MKYIAIIYISESVCHAVFVAADSRVHSVWIIFIIYVIYYDVYYFNACITVVVIIIN